MPSKVNKSRAKTQLIKVSRTLENVPQGHTNTQIQQVDRALFSLKAELDVMVQKTGRVCPLMASQGSFFASAACRALDPDRSSPPVRFCAAGERPFAISLHSEWNRAGQVHGAALIRFGKARPTTKSGEFNDPICFEALLL